MKTANQNKGNKPVIEFENKKILITGVPVLSGGKRVENDYGNWNV